MVKTVRPATAFEGATKVCPATGKVLVLADERLLKVEQENKARLSEPDLSHMHQVVCSNATVEAQAASQERGGANGIFATYKNVFYLK